MGVFSTSGSRLLDSIVWQAGEDGDEPGGHRNYICPALQTGLCDWSAKYFAQPVMKVASQFSPFRFDPTSLAFVSVIFSVLPVRVMCQAICSLCAFVSLLSIGCASKSEHNKVLLVEFLL